MIKIKLNISLYYLNDDMRMDDVTEKTIYYYPENMGINVDINNEIYYYNKDLIVEHFKKYDSSIHCFLDNTVSISYFSRSRYKKFLRLVKINNVFNS